MSAERILKQPVEVSEEISIKKPSMYKVLFYNDHFTTMDFVVTVLGDVFRKTRQEAVQIMLEVHKKGRGVVGIFSYDVARTKAELVKRRARQEEFPLRCTVEKS